MGLANWMYQKRKVVKKYALGNRVVFHHIPKCAGTSVSRALRIKYFMSEHSIAASGTAHVACNQSQHNELSDTARLNRIRTLRIDLLHYFMWKDYYYAGGHVPFSSIIYENFKSSYKFVTVLRDPVERYISEYFYNYKRDHQAKIDLPIEDYINSEMGVRNASKLSEYLCGSRDYNPREKEINFSNAKSNLRNFSVIGFTDNMDSFRVQLKRELGKNVKIGVANKRTTSQHVVNQNVTPSIRKEIEDLCSLDIQLFEYAKKIYG